MPILDELLKAKKYSDNEEYKSKHAILHNLLKKYPSQFKIDSSEGNIVGITHKPTKFQIHTTKESLPTMPQKSKSQQRTFGWVRAVQKGEASDQPAFIKRMARDIDPKSVKDFQETTHEGLPAKKAEQFLRGYYKQQQIVNQQVNQVVPQLDKPLGKTFPKPTRTVGRPTVSPLGFRRG